MATLALGVLVVLIASALVGMLFFAGGMIYACKVTFLLPNWVLLLIVFAVVTGFVAFARSRVGLRLALWIRERGGIIDRASLLATFILFCALALIVRRYAFVTGWDSWHIISDALNLLTGEPIDLQYFSAYPNNLLLLRFVELCVWVAQQLGVTSYQAGVLVACAFNCASCALAAWLTYRLLAELVGRGWGIVGWLLVAVVVGGSPWLGIAYSDPIVVCLPILQLFLFERSMKADGPKRAILWMSMGLLAYVAYAIKPQAAFVPIAVVLFCCVRIAASSIRERSLGSLRHDLPCAASFIAGMAVSIMLVGAVVAPVRARLDTDASVGIPHYFMMGLNPTTMGIYSLDDVTYSVSQPDQGTRTRANLEEAGRRLIAYGPTGVAELMARKLMTNFNDGTFAWGMEGGFFENADPNVDGMLTRLIRSFYYPGGANYELWRTAAQGMWVGVLALGLIGVACELVQARRGGGVSDAVVVLAGALVMLILFELIFEARARYLFSSVPLFCVLAVLGLRAVRLQGSSRSL